MNTMNLIQDAPVMVMAPDDYDRARQRHMQAFVAQVPGEVEKLAWPLERLHAMRDARLRALVRTAKERSPWHAERLRHIDPDTLSGDDLSAIPPMTRADLMAHWDDIVTDRRLTLDRANRHLARVAAHGPAYLLDDYHVIASGGSTGKRGVFAWDFEGWLQSQ
jgi:phenylacetate-CoA ligase